MYFKKGPFGSVTLSSVFNRVDFKEKHIENTFQM